MVKLIDEGDKDKIGGWTTAWCATLRERATKQLTSGTGRDWTTRRSLAEKSLARSTTNPGAQRSLREFMHAMMCSVSGVQEHHRRKRSPGAHVRSVAERALGSLASAAVLPRATIAAHRCRPRGSVETLVRGGARCQRRWCGILAWLGSEGSHGMRGTPCGDGSHGAATLTRSLGT